MAERSENMYVGITSHLPELFLNCGRSSLSHMIQLGFHQLPASYVALEYNRSVTNKGSPHSLSSHPFQPHRPTSQALEQPVPLSAHSPTRPSYLNQDIASSCTSTSRTRVASRPGVGHWTSQSACSPNSFFMSTLSLRTVRPTHMSVSFPSRTLKASLCHDTGERTRIAASSTSSCWRIPDQS